MQCMQRILYGMETIEILTYIEIVSKWGLPAYLLYIVHFDVGFW